MRVPQDGLVKRPHREERKPSERSDSGGDRSSGGRTGAVQLKSLASKPVSSARNDGVVGSFGNSAVFRYRWMILTACALTMLVTFIYAKRQKPMYRSTATFLTAEPGLMKSAGRVGGVLPAVRSALGGGFPAPPFRLRSGFTVPP